jgi:hypothetical protein
VVQEEPRFFPYCVIINASDDTIDLLSLRSYFRSYEPHGITFNVARAGLSFYERLHCRDDEVLDLVSAKAGLR